MTKKLFVCVIVFFSAQAFSQQQGMTDTEIVVGAHTVESGPNGMFAVWSKATAAYFDRVNEAGGVFGRKIKYIRIDTQGDAAKTVQATKKLVEEDKIFAMVGSIGVSHQAVFKYLMEKDVPDLFFVDHVKVYYEPVKKTVFPYAYSILSEGHVIGKHIVKNHKGEKVCLLITDNANGEDVAQGIREEIETANKSLKGEKEKINIAATEHFSMFDIQANTQVLSLKKAACNVVVSTALGSLGPKIIAYGASQGFKPSWYTQGGNVSDVFLGLLPDTSKNGILGVADISYDATIGASKAGIDEYKAFIKKSGLPENTLTSRGYTIGERFVEVLKRAGKDLTREKVTTAAESLNGWKCNLCINPLEISKTNHAAEAYPTLLITADGKWKRAE